MGGFDPEKSAEITRCTALDYRNISWVTFIASR